MTVVAVSIGAVALVLLLVAVVRLGRLHTRLVELDRALAERPPALSVAEAAVIAETAAARAVAEVSRRGLPTGLPSSPDEERTASRLSGPRIKASGWAAGASETVRRLRQGA